MNYSTHLQLHAASPRERNMIPQPVLTTARLTLRPLASADAAQVELLAGDREVASTTRLIPHPYPAGLAAQWIATLGPLYDQGRSASFGLTLADGTLIGVVGLTIEPADQHAELGYWIGRPFWNRGYCTEAAIGVLQFAFEGLKLQRVFAHYVARNSASGRVMQKLGLRQEGCLRQHRQKWGKFDDLIVCGILRDEFLAPQR